MAERKPERPKANELLTATIKTDANHSAYPKLNVLSKCRVTNMAIVGIVFNRRKN